VALAASVKHRASEALDDLVMLARLGRDLPRWCSTRSTSVR